VNKPAGLLTTATERERERTAHHILTEYIRRGCGRSLKNLYLVHRLDRDTSGTLIFAKSEETKLRLQDRWKETKKTYLAVVYGKCEKSSDTITSYLAEDRAYNVYETDNSSQGKLSHTAYTVLKVTRGLTLLSVDLLTGRKNQIRVHLAGRGHPIVGDIKYGRENDPHPRMALHARSLSFRHPRTGETLTVEAEIPEFFATLVGPLDLSSGQAGSTAVPSRPASTPGNVSRLARPTR
jgi:tRNA pseudouridine32 synthase/23S rRNA pseudouridine746 synthase/23S rRNA pseudouridine1911/1915/1917 synthase